MMIPLEPNTRWIRAEDDTHFRVNGISLIELRRQAKDGKLSVIVTMPTNREITVATGWGIGEPQTWDTVIETLKQCAGGTWRKGANSGCWLRTEHITALKIRDIKPGLSHLFAYLTCGRSVTMFEDVSIGSDDSYQIIESIVHEQMEPEIKDNAPEWVPYFLSGDPFDVESIQSTHCLDFCTV